MKYFALIYDGAEGYAERRAPFREEHLRLVREAHARGDISMAGAVGDPPAGAMFVFRSESPAAAEAFARQDPYVVNGVIARWQVKPWNVVVGP